MNFLRIKPKQWETYKHWYCIGQRDREKDRKFLPPTFLILSEDSDIEILGYKDGYYFIDL